MFGSGRNVIVVPVSEASPHALDRAERHADLVPLLEGAAIAAHLRQEGLGERVHDAAADAVEAAGHLVALAAELAAGVEDGQDHLEGALAPLVGHRRDGDAAPVVVDGARAIGVEGDLDAVAVPGEGLVDAVVHQLVDEVVESARARRADVHARSPADRFESLEDGDVPRVVGRCNRRYVGRWLDLMPPQDGPGSLAPPSP